MVRRLIHTIAVAVVAAAAGLIGVWCLGGSLESPLTLWVVCASILIWLPFANIYARLENPWTYALGFGLLSPIVGCFIVGPPL
jgi:hypothetical protein